MKRWLAVLCAGSMSAAAWAAVSLPRQYSADIVTEAHGHAMTMKMYVDGGKIRSEMEMPAVGGQQAAMRMITIVRSDLKRAYLLYPATQQYEERAINPQDLQMATASNEQAEIQEIGPEAVNGQPCTKYKVTHEGHGAWFWLSQATQLPVQLMPLEGGALVEFKNVQKGPQPAALFEVPAGWQKGSGMMGMAMGMMPEKDREKLNNLPPEVRDQLRKLTGQ